MQQCYSSVKQFKRQNTLSIMLRMQQKHEEYIRNCRIRKIKYSDKLNYIPNVKEQEELEYLQQQFEQRKKTSKLVEIIFRNRAHKIFAPARNLKVNYQRYLELKKS